MEVPGEWEQLSFDAAAGVVMILGAPDLGKTTFARYLYRRLSATGVRVAYLDGDPGQSTLGPPATLTLALGQNGSSSFPPKNSCWRSFIGAVSPQGHMLPMLVGASRLIAAGREAGADTVIYDTCGFIDPGRGGNYLKLALVDLIGPSTVIAFQRKDELESTLEGLRRSRRFRLFEIAPSSHARRRDPAARQRHRAHQFARYFAEARAQKVRWGRFAVTPTPLFSPHRLVAFEDVHGLTLGLGILQEENRRSRYWTVLTPLADLGGVDTIRLGDLLVDPVTFRDQPPVGTGFGG